MPTIEHAIQDRPPPSIHVSDPWYRPTHTFKVYILRNVSVSCLIAEWKGGGG